MAKPKFIPLPAKTSLNKLRAYVKMELKSQPYDAFEDGYTAAMRAVLRKIERLEKE